MGSFTASCAVTGVPFREGELVVGFMLRRKEGVPDPAHRPILSLMDLWEPMHLPIHGTAGDGGELISTARHARPIDTAKAALAGFDYREESWEPLLSQGLAPGPDGPEKSPYEDGQMMLWQVREDVFDFLTQTGRDVESSKVPTNDWTESLIDASDKTEPASVGDLMIGQQFRYLLKGLTAIGYLFRRLPSVAGGSSTEKQRNLKADFFALPTIQPGSYPDKGPFLRCGITGAPLRSDSNLMMLPICAQQGKNPNWIGELFLDDRAPTGCYLLDSIHMPLRLDEQGELTHNEALSVSISGLKDASDPEYDERLTFMAVSEDALIQLNPPEAVQNKLQEDAEEIVDAAKELRHCAQLADQAMLYAYIRSITADSRVLQLIEMYEKEAGDLFTKEHGLRDFRLVIERLIRSFGNRAQNPNTIAAQTLCEFSPTISHRYQSEIFGHLETFITSPHQDSYDYNLSLLQFLMDQMHTWHQIHYMMSRYGLAVQPTEMNDFAGNAGAAAETLRQIRSVVRTHIAITDGPEF